MSFPAAFFSQWVTVLSRSYPLGAMGGAQPVESPTATSYKVVALQPTRLENRRSESVGEVTASKLWRLTFNADPAIGVDQTIAYHPLAGGKGFTAMPYRGEWSSTTSYAAADVVTVTPTGGVAAHYYAVAPSTNDKPPSANWVASRTLSAASQSLPVFQDTGELWRVEAQEIL